MHISTAKNGAEKRTGMYVILTPLYIWYAGPVYMIIAMISPRFNLAFRTSGRSDFKRVLRGREAEVTVRMTVNFLRCIFTQ